MGRKTVRTEPSDGETRQGLSKCKTVFLWCGVLVLLQAIRFGLKEAAYCFVPQTTDDHLVSMCVLPLMTVGMVLIAKRLGLSAEIFPKTRKRLYLILGVIAVALFLSGALLFGAGDLGMLRDAVYSSLVIPVFEETIFRGYLWESLKGKFEQEWLVYLITTVLFSLWHFGYVDSLIIRIGIDGLGYVMLMKAFVGLVYGIIVGFVRYRTKNTYAAMLVHSVMNTFGR